MVAHRAARVSKWAYAGPVTELEAGVRAVMVVIDALPHRHVGPTLTPHLWRQVGAGGRAPQGGMSLPVSVTYANHAAFVTGADPSITGVYGNHTWIGGEGWVRSPKAGPRARTLFDAVGDAGGRSVAVVGDHKLVAQMGAHRADVSWPPGGWIPDGVERCEFGYVTDAEVVRTVNACDLDADLVVLHLNQPDTTSHLYGPDSPEALHRYRQTDEAYGALVDALAAGWDRTVLVTLSDHDQEEITDQTPVPIVDALAGRAALAVVTEGTAALIHGPVDDDVIATMHAVPGVEGSERLDDDVWMAWTVPGRMFDAAPIPLGGQHGSPRCRAQVAVVSGGDGRVPELAARLAAGPPSALDWAPTIAGLLGVAELGVGELVR